MPNGNAYRAGCSPPARHKIGSPFTQGSPCKTRFALVTIHVTAPQLTDETAQDGSAGGEKKRTQAVSHTAPAANADDRKLRVGGTRAAVGSSRSKKAFPAVRVTRQGLRRWCRLTAGLPVSVAGSGNNTKEVSSKSQTGENRGRIVPSGHEALCNATGGHQVSGITLDESEFSTIGGLSGFQLQSAAR